MRKIIKYGLIGIAVMVICGLGYMFLSMRQMQNHILNEEISEVNVTSISDGTYVGEYYYKELEGITVSVIVNDGEIIDIEYSNHLTGLGIDSENIRNEIIESQSILVDDISGATTSSRCIKLAIMEALKNEE